jgi:hypothetical protein
LRFAATSIQGDPDEQRSQELQLDVALAGLRQWGDTYLSKTPPRILRRRSDKKPVLAAFVPKGARTLEFRELELVPGRDRRDRSA